MSLDFSWFLDATWQTTVAFFAVLAFARLLGKEQISQLTFYDYITGITFGNLAANVAMAEPGKELHSFWVLTLFCLIAYCIGFVTLKSRPLRKIIEGEPVMVIHNGKIMEKNMRKMRFNLENLMTLLRDKGIFNVADVEFAVLETNGALSVLPKAQKRPVTPSDLQISTSYEGIPTELILKGKVVYRNLAENSLDEKWLIQALNQHGINSPAEVFYASLDTKGELYIDRWEEDEPTESYDKF